MKALMVKFHDMLQVAAKAHDDCQMRSHARLEAAAGKAWQQVITGASGLAYQFQQRQSACGSLLSRIVMKVGCSPSSRKIHFARKLHRVW